MTLLLAAFLAFCHGILYVLAGVTLAVVLERVFTGLFRWLNRIVG